jgi:thiol-disulfide isomerase/thioredoxin
MNSKQAIIMAILFLCLASTTGLRGKAQNKKQALHIGDTVPDVTIPVIQNYKKNTVQFSEFKGKAVILDFWFGYCKGCVEAFPKLEALQKKFKDSVQILLVNFESQSQIDSVFKRLKRVSSLYKLPSLPSIVSDTILHKYFMFETYPHEVWIDKYGVVKAFTGSKDVTESNIRAFLNGLPLKADMKWEDIAFESNQAVLPQLYQRSPERLKYYSSIFSYTPEINFGGTSRRDFDSLNGTVRVTRKNRTILQLLGDALKNGLSPDPFESPDFDFGKRVVLNIKDSGRYFYKAASGTTLGTWKAGNCYTYETVLPIDQEPALFRKMLTDVQQYFNLSCRVEKRMMKCLALVRTSERDLIKSTKKPLSNFDDKKDSSKMQYYAMFTQRFVGQIATHFRNTSYLFANNTGYTGRIDIELDKKVLTDIPSLKKELKKKYDLDLVETVQLMDVLIITENDYEKNNAISMKN